MTADQLSTALQEAAPDLLAYLMRRVGEHDAPDLLAETMITVWRRSSELPHDPERQRMWFFGIARGSLRNHARGESRRWALADRIRLDPRTTAASPGADEGMEVRDAIARLEPDLAELVRLVHWDGFSLTEAAELVGIPASTARGRYQRAKMLLREALAAAEPNERCTEVSA